MSILGIIGISILITFLAVSIHCLGCAIADSYDSILSNVALFVYLGILTVSVFIGIGINTENEILYIAEYTTQKTTIEQSLESASIDGLERVELVNKAVELNGELALRKRKYDIWHYVTYDSTMYDDVEFIVFN